MPVKLRLSRKGRKKAPFYHIVVADSRASRDGKFIQKLGTYNPMTRPATIEIDRDAAYDWLVKGAQPTDTVKAILRFKGVYYKKHLMRGLAKGALTQDQVDTMWKSWIDAKELKVDARRAQTKAELAEFRKMVSGEAKPKTVVADAATKETAQSYMAETASNEESNVDAVVDNVEEVVESVAADVVEVDATPEVVEVVEEVVSETVADENVATTEEEVKDASTEEAPKEDA